MKTIQISDNLHTIITQIKADTGKPVSYIINELLILALKMKKIEVKKWLLGYVQF